MEAFREWLLGQETPSVQSASSNGLYKIGRGGALEKIGALDRTSGAQQAIAGAPPENNEPRR